MQNGTAATHSIASRYSARPLLRSAKHDAASLHLSPTLPDCASALRNFALAQLCYTNAVLPKDQLPHAPKWLRKSNQIGYFAFLIV